MRKQPKVNKNNPGGMGLFQASKTKDKPAKKKPAKKS